MGTNCISFMHQVVAEEIMGAMVTMANYSSHHRFHLSQLVILTLRKRTSPHSIKLRLIPTEDILKKHQRLSSQLLAQPCQNTHFQYLGNYAQDFLAGQQHRLAE